ncbi:MAG: carboxypeptidase regulatory-like domain-containing protein [Bacillota bacterium]
MTRIKTPMTTPPRTAPPRLIGAVLIALTLTAAGLLSAACRAGGQAATATLQGSVTAMQEMAPGRFPKLAGAKVTLEPGKQSTVTVEGGKFAFAKLPAGAYRLTVEADGFVTYHSTEPVLAPAGATVDAPVFIFPEPAGAPQAQLSVQSEDATVPYGVILPVSISGTKEAAPDGIRWQVVGPDGRVLADPYLGAGHELQLKVSSMPGSTPFDFEFVPPKPGRYVLRLLLTNKLGPRATGEAVAEAAVVAANTAPEAVPSVIAGPNPPSKQSAGGLRASSGLTVVDAGRTVYLRGWAVDVNMPSPEVYNPGGVDPDLYGKNHDQYQRQFKFLWRLEYSADGRTGWTDVSARLTYGSAADVPVPSQYPRFTADRAGYYRATLRVSDQDPAGALTGSPVSLTVLAEADGRVDPGACASCHGDRVASWKAGPHGQTTGAAGCQDCHGPARAHLSVDAGDAAAKRATISVSLASGTCGQCHKQYAEWEKARHSDGYSYGYSEVAEPLLLNCVKCHNPKGFAQAITMAKEQGKGFEESEFKVAPPGAPANAPAVLPDFSKLPPKDDAGVSCATCHDPHPTADKDGKVAPFALRAGATGATCDTCHREKWQNAVLEAKAGQYGNGYDWRPADKIKNPHDTADKCVLCHMATGVTGTDAVGVRLVGGHTLRMRDAGPDGLLGGYGPRADDPSKERGPSDKDDVLNLAACQSCHKGLDTFDREGVQKKVHDKWATLGDLLKERNGGVLPEAKPGDKCATCHRGGTLPFKDDPDLVLERAYTNYKLIKNDRSWGVHNPSYVLQLLDDSIKHVKEDYRPSGGQ